MIIVAGIATTLFLGGWLRDPFARWHDHFPGTSLRFFDVIPSLVFLAAAGYCFYLAPKQPVQIQKIVMAAFGAACLLLAGAMAAALFASPVVMAGIHGAISGLMAKVVAYLYGFLSFRIYISALPLRSADAPWLALF